MPTPAEHFVEAEELVRLAKQYFKVGDLSRYAATVEFAHVHAILATCMPHTHSVDARPKSKPTP